MDRLSLLPGPQEIQPRMLNLVPVAVRHFSGFSAGLGFLDENLHALFPLVVHWNRRSITVPEEQKQFGGFLEEFISTGEITALNNFVDALLEVARQCNIHHRVLPTALYGSGLTFFNLYDCADTLLQKADPPPVVIETRRGGN